MDDGSRRVKTWMFFSGDAPARRAFFAYFLCPHKESMRKKYEKDGSSPPPSWFIYKFYGINPYLTFLLATFGGHR